MTLCDYVKKTDRQNLLLEWDRASNGQLSPENVIASSREKVAWVCERGHRWQCAVVSRTQGGTGCPYCAGRLPIPGETDLLTLRPDVARLWDSEKNGCGPDRVMPMSRRLAHWRCERGHEWIARVHSVSNGSGCPYCAGKKPIPGLTDLATTDPVLASEWDAEKNSIQPSGVSGGSAVEVWWRCPEGHSYRAPVYARRAGTGCPYCSGNKVLPGETDLATTDPALCLEWDDPNCKPTELNRGSHKLVRWKCPLGHSYEAAVFSRIAGTGCPYCSGNKVLRGFNDLATTNPTIAAQWDYERNGDLSPEQITRGSSRKVWWRCSEGHVWRAVVFSRTRARPADCPVCAGRVRKSTEETYTAAKRPRPALVPRPAAETPANRI